MWIKVGPQCEQTKLTYKSITYQGGQTKETWPITCVPVQNPVSPSKQLFGHLSQLPAAAS